MLTESHVLSPSPTLIWTRFGPGEDPQQSIAALATKLEAGGGSIVTCLGSLSRVTYMIAIPDQLRTFRYSEPITLEGPIELVAAQGTWGRDAQTGEVVVHLHAVMVDKDGRAFGGHLVPGGNRVLATAEVALLTGPGIAIVRQFDPSVGVALLNCAPVRS